MINRKLVNDLIEFYTNTGVMVRTIEEISELINELTKDNIDRKHLAEEVVDCFICSELLINVWRRETRKDLFKPTCYTEDYSNKEVINTLSSLQFVLCKELRYFDYRREHIVKFVHAYRVLFFLIDKYRIDREVEEWFKLKDEKLTKLIRDKGVNNIYEK